MYCALTVDLKHSRQYGDQERWELQEYLVRTTELLNQIFGDSLEKELRFSGGDELQGLFLGADAAILCFRLLRRMIFPIQLHAGFGTGEWSVQIPNRDTFYQDGSAYHLAREALEQAKRETDWEAVFCSGNPEADRMQTAVLNAALCLTKRNTDHQNELAVLLECLFPLAPNRDLRERYIAEIPELMAERYTLTYYKKRFARSGKPRVMAAVAAEGVTMPRSSGREELPHPRGAASELARLADLKRQSVDTALRSANVYQERALILALMKL